MKKILRNVLVAMTGLLVLASCMVTTPRAASDAPIGSKKGTSATIVVAGAIFLNKNYGLEEAIKNGKMTRGIAIIDEKVSDFILFQKRELFIYGE